MRNNASKLEASKEKKASRKKKLSKAAEEKKKADAKAKKKRKARPKSPEEKDDERLPGTCSVEAGSPVITTTEVLAGAIGPTVPCSYREKTQGWISRKFVLAERGS